MNIKKILLGQDKLIVPVMSNRRFFPRSGKCFTGLPISACNRKAVSIAHHIVVPERLSKPLFLLRCISVMSDIHYANP